MIVAILRLPRLSGTIYKYPFRNDLEMLKIICDSEDYSIFISPEIDIEIINISDILEYWILREYAELVFVRAAIGSSRRRNLSSILILLQKRESIEASNFIFDPMKESKLDDLRNVTLGYLIRTYILIIHRFSYIDLIRLIYFFGYLYGYSAERIDPRKIF